METDLQAYHERGIQYHETWQNPFRNGNAQGTLQTAASGKAVLYFSLKKWHGLWRMDFVRSFSLLLISSSSRYGGNGSPKKPGLSVWKVLRICISKGPCVVHRLLAASLQWSHANGEPFTSDYLWRWQFKCNKAATDNITIAVDSPWSWYREDDIQLDLTPSMYVSLSSWNALSGMQGQSNGVMLIASLFFHVENDISTWKVQFGQLCTNPNGHFWSQSN